MKLKRIIVIVIGSIPVMMLLTGGAYAATCADPCDVNTTGDPRLRLNDTDGADHDWQINNFGVGATSELRIHRIGGAVSFKIEHEAPANSLVVKTSATNAAQTGIGIGTSSPQETLDLTNNQPGIRMNDANGGRADIEMSGNIFSIQENSDTNRFVIETNGAGARANQVYLKGNGNVGILNPNPQDTLHVKAQGGNLTLEGGTGVPYSKWQMATISGGGLWLRDLKNGKTPFEIEGNAQEDQLYLKSNGNVGIGTNNPEAPTHIRDTASTMLLLENTHATKAIRRVMRMENKGAVGFEMVDRSIPSPGLEGRTWQFRSDGVGNFIVNQPQFPGAELQIQNDGDLIVKGNVTEGSSRAIKTDIQPIKVKDFMDKVSKVEVLEWRYKSSDKDDMHIGPMAEDFYKLFKLGVDDKHISARDVASVALLAAKELQQKSKKLQKGSDTMAQALKSNESKTVSLEAKTKMLEAENSTLKNRLLALERLVTNLASGEGALPESGNKLSLLK